MPQLLPGHRQEASVAASMAPPHCCLSGLNRWKLTSPEQVFLALKVTHHHFQKYSVGFPRPDLFSIRGGYLGRGYQEMKLEQAIVVALQHAPNFREVITINRILQVKLQR